MASTKKSAPTKNNNNGILAFLCYLLWPVALLILLLDKRERDLRYHAINGLGFGILLTIVWWLASLLLWGFWMLSQVIGLVALIYAILLGVRAYNGEKPEIPLITDLIRQNVKDFR